MLEEREEVRGGKRRRGRQWQGGEKWERGRRRENRRSGRGFAMAGSEKRHHAKVSRGGVGMETFVPPRRDTEQARRE